MDLKRAYTEGETLKDTKGKDFKLFGLEYTQLVFVAAKGKTFTMGDNNSGYEDEKETQITFDQNYWIGQFAVTQELYEKVMGSNPSTFIGKHRPVEMVSWDDIINDFLPKLNQLIRAEYPALKAEFALPSEAQWEYAAAGGQQWNAPKLEYAGSNNLNDVGWFRDNTKQESTMPVGLKEPNALGLYDMSGNVWEWCQDDYKNSLSNLPKNDLAGANQKDANKLLRGGSYYSSRILCRVRARNRTRPANRHDNYGIRLVFPSV